MLYFNQCPRCGGTVELKYEELKCLHCARTWYDRRGLDQGVINEANLDYDFYRRLVEEDGE